MSTPVAVVEELLLFGGQSLEDFFALFTNFNQKIVEAGEASFEFFDGDQQAGEFLIGARG